jgi:hypothetical protein
MNLGGGRLASKLLLLNTHHHFFGVLMMYISYNCFNVAILACGCVQPQCSSSVFGTTLVHISGKSHTMLAEGIHDYPTSLQANGEQYLYLTITFSYHILSNYQ